MNNCRLKEGEYLERSPFWIFPMRRNIFNSNYGTRKSEQQRIRIAIKRSHNKLPWQIVLPFVSLSRIIPLESHLKPHANTKLRAHSLQIPVHTYDKLARPKKTNHQQSSTNDLSVRHFIVFETSKSSTLAYNILQKESELQQHERQLQELPGACFDWKSPMKACYWPGELDASLQHVIPHCPLYTQNLS